MLFDELFEDAGGFGLHPGEDVLVGVDGEGGVRVTETLRDHLDRDSGFDQQGPVGVPDVVKSDFGNSGPRSDPLEGLGDRMRVDGFPVVLVNTQPLDSTPVASCSVFCQSRQAMSTLSVVASRSMARHEFGVLPLDSWSS